MKTLFLFAVLFIAPRCHAQALDTYLGYANVHCSSATGNWYTSIVSGHAVICNPLGDVFYGKCADVVDDSLGSNNQFGHGNLYYENARFGNQTIWANQTMI